MAGCSLTPTYERPAAPVAADWPAPAPAAPASATRSASELPWADFVGDASLRELIRLALVNNRDLRVAVLNIEQARATWQIRRADQFPTVNLGATGAVQPKTDGSGTNSAYTAGLSFTGWELDLFGRVASLKDAALAQYLASEESRRAVQASLIAAVANTWLNLQTNDELLAITQSTLKTREDSLRLTRLRLDNGASSALDVRQAESLTAGALAALQQQQRLRAQDLNALTLLVGQPLPPSLLVPAPAPAPTADGRSAGPPQARPAPSGGSDVHKVTSVGAIFTEVPAGLPSDLLTRRPDIRQAEQQLIAANANIGAARAAFFPRITLTAAYGTANAIHAPDKSTIAAMPQNSARQPITGSSHCTGSVEATMPSEPVISIHALARNCAAGLYQRRKPVSGAIRQALTPAPNSTRPTSKPVKPVASANTPHPSTAMPKKDSSTLRGPWRSSQWPKGSCVMANPRKYPPDSKPRSAAPRVTRN